MDRKKKRIKLLQKEFLKIYTEIYAELEELENILENNFNEE